MKPNPKRSKSAYARLLTMLSGSKKFANASLEDRMEVVMEFVKEIQGYLDLNTEGHLLVAIGKIESIHKAIEDLKAENLYDENAKDRLPPDDQLHLADFEKQVNGHLKFIEKQIKNKIDEKEEKRRYGPGSGKDH